MVIETVSKGIGVKAWLNLIEGEAPMFDNLNVFKMARALAVHAGTRQTVIAQNIANADTPGYRARDIPPFQDIYNLSGNQSSQRASRPAHLRTSNLAGQIDVQLRDAGFASPNENDVSLELEMLHAVDVKRQHDRAVSIYSSALNILRTSVGQV